MKKIKALISVLLIMSVLAGCTAKAVSENEHTSGKAEKESVSETETNTSIHEETATVPESTSKIEETTADEVYTTALSTSKKESSSSSAKPNNTASKPSTVTKPTTTKKHTTTTKPTTTKPTTTKPQEKYTVTELKCKNGNLNIYGKMYKPNKSGKMPVVIMSHSFGLNSASLATYASLMAENGYAAYIFDFCGGSFMGNKSDGKFEDMTVFTEVSDLEAVISKIRSLSYVDKNNVFLFGTSQGGLVSALTANNYNSQIKGMILLYPGFSMAEQVASNGQMAGVVLSKKYIDAIKNYDIYGNIGGFKKDVLIIHGTKDTQVPISYSERAVNVYKSAELVRIDGANHGFNSSNNFGMGGNFDKEVNPHILEFMKNHTK